MRLNEAPDSCAAATNLPQAPSPKACGSKGNGADKMKQGGNGGPFAPKLRPPISIGKNLVSKGATMSNKSPLPHPGVMFVWASYVRRYV